MEPTSKINIAGLLVDSYSKKDSLRLIENRLQGNLQTFIVTPYSEFLYHALLNKEWATLCNLSDLSIADGIAIQWASVFLQLPLKSRLFYLKVVETFFQLFYSLSWILFSPKKIKALIPEKIVGADFFWDLIELANKKNLSVYLLGGFGETPKIVAEKIKLRFPKIIIAGTSNKSRNDDSVFEDINKAKPDVLMVAFGPLFQEQWIAEHLKRLPVKIAIGLGGTFDYIAGARRNPPQFVRRSGLEWLYRLITQPHRFKRIYHATFGLCLALVRYKVFTSLPYRDNVVCVVINQNNELLICKRKLDYINHSLSGSTAEEYWQFPQGGIDRGEALIAAALRELKEETGIDSVSYLATSNKQTSYDWRNGTKKLLFNPLKFRGQQQRIVYLKFTGQDSEIKLDQHELVAYQWVSSTKLLSVIHSEREPLATIVINDLKQGL